MTLSKTSTTRCPPVILQKILVFQVEASHTKVYESEKYYLKVWAKALWVYQYHGVIILAPTNRVQNKDTKHKSLIGLKFLQNKNKNDEIQFS